MSNNAVKSLALSIAIHATIAFGWLFLYTDDKEVAKKEALPVSMSSFIKTPQKDAPKQEPVIQKKRTQKSDINSKIPSNFTKQQKDIWSHKNEEEATTLANEHNANTTPPKENQSRTATNIQEQKADTSEPKIDEAKEYIGLNGSKIRELIAKHKRYPSQAVKMGIEGVCHISFRLNPNGDADNIKVVKSSSFSALDRSSIQTIEDAALYMPKPQKSVTLVVPIEYRLN